MEGACALRALIVIAMIQNANPLLVPPNVVTVRTKDCEAAPALSAYEANGDRHGAYSGTDQEFVIAPHQSSTSSCAGAPRPGKKNRMGTII